MNFTLGVFRIPFLYVSLFSLHWISTKTAKRTAKKRRNLHRKSLTFYFPNHLCSRIIFHSSLVQKDTFIIYRCCWVNTFEKYYRSISSITITKNDNVWFVYFCLDNYIPSMYGMPSYLVNLAKRVNWDSEQECFATFAHETSRFYAVPPGDDKLNEEVSSVSFCVALLSSRFGLAACVHKPRFRFRADRNSVRCFQKS